MIVYPLVCNFHFHPHHTSNNLDHPSTKNHPYHRILLEEENIHIPKVPILLHKLAVYLGYSFRFHHCVRATNNLVV